MLVAQQPTPVIKKEATTPVSVVVEATVADTADTPVVDDEAEDVQVVADATEPYVSIISYFLSMIYSSFFFFSFFVLVLKLNGWTNIDCFMLEIFF